MKNSETQNMEREDGTMKLPYEELELEVIRFGAEDIITASDASEDEDITEEETPDEDETPTNNTGEYQLLDTNPANPDMGLYLTPDGHYVIMLASTGEIIRDFGEDDPRDETHTQ